MVFKNGPDRPRRDRHQDLGSRWHGDRAAVWRAITPHHVVVVRRHLQLVDLGRALCTRWRRPAPPTPHKHRPHVGARHPGRSSRRSDPRDLPTGRHGHHCRCSSTRRRSAGTHRRTPLRVAALRPRDLMTSLFPALADKFENAPGEVDWMMRPPFLSLAAHDSSRSASARSSSAIRSIPALWPRLRPCGASAGRSTRRRHPVVSSRSCSPPCSGDRTSEVLDDPDGGGDGQISIPLDMVTVSWLEHPLPQRRHGRRDVRTS